MAEFPRSIEVVRERIDFGYSVLQTLSTAAVLPIALNTSTLRAAELAPFADLDVKLIQNFHPGLNRAGAVVIVLVGVGVGRRFRWRVGAFITGYSARRRQLGEGLPTVEGLWTMPALFPAMALVDAGVNDVHVWDPALIDQSLSRLGSFVLDEVVVFDGTAAPGMHQAVIEPLVIPHRNGPDAAEAMIRLKHSRERFAGLPAPEVRGQPRPENPSLCSWRRPGSSTEKSRTCSGIFPRIVESPSMGEFLSERTDGGIQAVGRSRFRSVPMGFESIAARSLANGRRVDRSAYVASSD